MKIKRKLIKKDKPRYKIVATYEAIFKRNYTKILGSALLEVTQKMADFVKEKP